MKYTRTCGTKSFISHSSIVIITLFAPYCSFALDFASSHGIIFSHQIHVEAMGMACTDCHADVTESTEPADNLLPAEEQCLECHDGSLAPKECGLCHTDPDNPQSYTLTERDYRFSHKFHLGLDSLTAQVVKGMEAEWYTAAHEDTRFFINEENTCSTCHRGMASADGRLASGMPHMDDCLLCHKTDPPEEDCRTCHLPDAELRPATHGINYLAQHQETVSINEERCYVCHAVDFCWECH